MSDKVKSRLMIAGAAFCAALFLFSGAMLAREYLDQKQSAEAFDEVAGLVKEDVELPALELATCGAGTAATGADRQASNAALHATLQACGRGLSPRVCRAAHILWTVHTRQGSNMRGHGPRQGRTPPARC